MAAVLRIENYAATTYVDLISDDVKIERGVPSFKLDPNDTQTTTVFRLRFNASTAAGIRTDFNELIVLLDQARKWHRDDLEANSVWLRWAADGETAKRSLIYDYGITNNAGVALDPLQLINRQLMIDLAITHDAEAEDVTSLTWVVYPYGGDNYAYYQLYNGSTTEAYGDRGSRIGFFKLDPGAGTINKIWLGIREVTYSAIDYSSKINYVWAAEDVTIAGTGMASTTSAGSYGTNVYENDFTSNSGSNALALRIAFTIINHIDSFAESNALKGPFQVLLRYKLEASTDVAVRMGVSDSADTYTKAAYNSFQYDLDDDAAWHWLELGLVKFPNQALRVMNIAASTNGETVDISQSTIWIDTERISGTGSLFIDCIQLIPYDHYIAVSGLKCDATSYPATIFTNENMTTDAYTRLALASDAIYSVGEAEAINDWKLPDAQIFLISWAIEGNTASTTPNSTAPFIQNQFYRRWAGYNGD